MATEKIIDFDKILIERPKLGRVFSNDKPIGEDSSKSSENAFIYSYINYFATLFILKYKKYLDDDEWKPYDSYIKSAFKNPRFIMQWLEIKDNHWYYKPFEDYINDIIKKDGKFEEKEVDIESSYSNNIIQKFEIVEVSYSESDLFNDSIKIYEEAFPSSEKEKISNIVNWINDKEKICPDKFHMLALRVEKNQEFVVIGIALFHYLDDIKAGFLGYIAIEKTNRNRGYGSVLFEAILSTIEKDSKKISNNIEPLGIFAELDKEDIFNPLSFERIKFWECHNLKPLMINWVYPSLYIGNTPADMYLGFKPFNKDHCSLSKEEMTKVCISIYRGVYHRDSNNPTLAKIIESFQDGSEIKQFNISNNKNKV